MTDKKLKELMDLTIEVRESYIATLQALEDEYKKRFGNYPSDVDDDYFIDTFHYGRSGKISVADMTEKAKGRELLF